jgi:phage baseplate assembly protein W
MSYDIHYEGLPEDDIRGARFLSFGPYDRTLAVQGIQKMVNRFLKCLCTPVGTDISDPEYGTDILNMFLGNVDSRTLEQVVLMAIRDAETQIKQYDVWNNAPVDERLSSALIHNIAVDPTNVGFSLTVQLANAAGTRVLVLVPSLVDTE